MEVVPNPHFSSHELSSSHNRQPKENKNEPVDISENKLIKKRKGKKNVRVQIDELSETGSKNKKKSLQEIENSSQNSICKNDKVKAKSSKIIEQNTERKGNLATCIKSSISHKNHKSEKELRSSKSIKFSEKRDVFTYKIDAKPEWESKSKTLKKVPKLLNEDKDCCVLI